MRHPKSKTRWLLSLLAVASTALLAAGVVWRTAAAGAGRRPSGRGAVAVERTAFLQEPKLSLEGGVAWINSGPIRLEELRGKVVLLDFWTYCCINCHHILPELAKLEQKYKNELVVIGVHTPKFFAEQDTENIRQKVHEYQIKHPVINDANQVLWNRFGVNSWPTLVLLDAKGEYVGSAPGESTFSLLDHVVGRQVALAKAKKILNTDPLTFFPESEKTDHSPLSYPGKVLADADGKRLFIADTAHNRLVVTDLQGKDPQVIGEGSPGLADGGYGNSRFNRPQGMCLVGETLYVADTENHALRAVDLKAKAVTTVAGTGQQSRRPRSAGLGKRTALSSPWDVILIPGTQSLAIAMAGVHEIWRYDIVSQSVASWAGTGEENIEDGPISLARFAQPSGLASDGHSLYVADSEVSALREIRLGKRPTVHTIVGSGLFVFDDVDGQGSAVRLQHCLGVAFGNGKLYVADTYNNKIKVCNPATRTVETLVGGRQPGSSDTPPRFYQPGGLSVAGTNLYVADTNNSKVRVVDLKQGTVQTLELDGLKPPTERRVPTFPNAQLTELSKTTVAPGDTVTLEVKVPLDSGEKLSPDASMPFLVETPEKAGILAPAFEGAGQKVQPPATPFTVEVKLAKPARAGDAVLLKLSVAAFVCNERSSLCRVKNFSWNIPLTFAENGADRVTVSPAAPRGE